LIRRIPRRGFNNVFKKEFAIINLRDLELHFESGDVVSQVTLREKRLVKGSKIKLVKILGSGTLSKKLTVQVNAISAFAAEAIQNAGGSFQLN